MYGCDFETADRICCYNRHAAEHRGYFMKTRWAKEVDQTKETTYYDSVSGKPLFIAPRGRSFEDFKQESIAHGWPSFRDQEVVWEMASLWPMKWVKTVPYLGTSGRSADSIYLYAHPQNLPPCCDVPIVLDETADLVWNVSQTTDMPQSIVLVTSTGGPFGFTSGDGPSPQ